MSTRSIFEINHDYSYKVKEDPEGFLLVVRLYLSSTSKENAERLEHYGFKRAWWGHHSDERKVVTKYNEVKL